MVARSSQLAARSHPLLSLRCGRLRSLGGAYPHCLYVHELAYAELGKLAPVSALLDPAEGETRVGGHHAVDEDGAGFDTPGQAARRLYVARPEISAQTERSSVGGLYRLFSVPHSDHSRYGAESLLGQYGHL